MTNEYQPTREQEAYGRLLEEKEQILSEAARTVLVEAENAANGQIIMGLQPQDYLEHMQKMHLASAELTSRDREILAEICSVALVAAASTDPNDYETPAGYRVYRGDLHTYYKMASGMIEAILNGDAAEEIKSLEEKIAEWGEPHEEESAEWDPEGPDVIYF